MSGHVPGELGSAVTVGLVSCMGALVEGGIVVQVAAIVGFPFIGGCCRDGTTCNSIT